MTKYKAQGELIFSEGRTNTHRTIAEYTELFGFKNENDFLKWISGKTVLDLGSGTGMLAKSVANMEANVSDEDKTHIINLNLSLHDPEFRKRCHNYTGDCLGINGNEEEISRVNGIHDDYAVAGDWSELPFKNESFERIVSLCSFPLHAKSFDEVKKTLRELTRVLKQGGEMLLSEIYDFKKDVTYYPEDYDKFKNFITEELGLVVEFNRGGFAHFKKH